MNKERYTENTGKEPNADINHLDKSKVQSKSPEESANFEGNESLLFFKRCEDPEILKQMVELHLKGYQEKNGVVENIPKKDAEGNDMRNEDNSYIFDNVTYEAPSEEEIKLEILGRIEEAKRKTNISYDDGIPSSDKIPLYWKLNDKVPTEKQKSIVEAHEKGHNVRHFPGGKYSEEMYKKLFGEVFDASNIEISDQDYAIYSNVLKKEYEEGHGNVPPEELTKEYVQSKLIEYVQEPGELLERMSQLKNYFGFEGNEKFTQEHLDYAREHYLKDTGMNNGMEHFFASIQDEDKFLDLINNSGV